jgi:hypothetical protein
MLIPVVESSTASSTTPSSVVPPTVAPGERSVTYGIQALEPAYITNRSDRVRAYRHAPSH